MNYRERNPCPFLTSAKKCCRLWALECFTASSAFRPKRYKVASDSLAWASVNSLSSGRERITSKRSALSLSTFALSDRLNLLRDLGRGSVASEEDAIEEETEREDLIRRREVRRLELCLEVRRGERDRR